MAASFETGRVNTFLWDFYEAKLAKPKPRAILATPMLPFFIGLLKFLVVIDCLLLILIILMQRPRQEGLGAAFGSGVTDQMFGAQTTNVLQKFTTWLGILLFLFTFILAILVAKTDGSSSNVKLLSEADKKAAAAPYKPEAAAPAATPAPAPAKPADAKPADATPAPAKPADAKPAPAPEAKPTPTPAAPAPAKPAESKPAAPAPAANATPAPVPATPPAAPATPAPAPAQPK